MEQDVHSSKPAAGPHHGLLRHLLWLLLIKSLLLTAIWFFFVRGHSAPDTERVAQQLLTASQLQQGVRK